MPSCRRLAESALLTIYIFESSFMPVEVIDARKTALDLSEYMNKGHHGGREGHAITAPVSNKCCCQLSGYMTMRPKTFAYL